jgi:hypothetical protein
VHALHQGFWLGLLEDEALQATITRYYTSHRRYTGPDHNTAGLLGWESALVDRHLAGCRTVLVGAAGGGREVVALARRGVAVDAFDCTPALVATAKQVLAAEGITAPVYLAPPDGMPSGLGTYDGVILGWGAYSHIAGRPARVRLLRDLASHLRKGGPLLVSLQTRPADPSAQRMFRWICAAARTIRAIRRSHAPVELGDNIHGCFAHRFTRTEIETEVAAAGLRLVHFEEREFGAVVARLDVLDMKASDRQVDRVLP